ncbi:MAG: hypothetical protein IPM96_21550 [Ignavibacteria bacterium]|nr:hypothetical protein [Ignavibacteria bacterium]
MSKINPSMVVNDNGTISTNYEDRNLNKFYGTWTETFGFLEIHIHCP